MNMQSVTAFNEEDHDPDLIVWDGEESDSDREGGEEMVNRGDWENLIDAEPGEHPNDASFNADNYEQWEWDDLQSRNEVQENILEEDESMDLDNLDLNHLDEYPVHDLRRYCQKESIDIEDLKSKEEIIQVILVLQ